MKYLIIKSPSLLPRDYLVAASGTIISGTDKDGKITYNIEGNLIKGFCLGGQ